MRRTIPREFHEMLEPLARLAFPDEADVDPRRIDRAFGQDGLGRDRVREKAAAAVWRNERVGQGRNAFLEENEADGGRKAATQYAEHVEPAAQRIAGAPFRRFGQGRMEDDVDGGSRRMHPYPIQQIGPDAEKYEASDAPLAA
ncbi:MAG: hypothetical protein EOP61_30500 [Sphingomonadales bacterium]|nr:MAG: hypothetical protein EOP61_30500 [Sphingomonadales bacterium]